jgi:hypothetical protein
VVVRVAFESGSRRRHGCVEAYLVDHRKVKEQDGDNFRVIQPIALPKLVLRNNDRLVGSAPAAKHCAGERRRCCLHLGGVVGVSAYAHAAQQRQQRHHLQRTRRRAARCVRRRKAFKNRVCAAQSAQTLIECLDHARVQRARHAQRLVKAQSARVEHAL